MQYNTIANMRVPPPSKKTAMFSSQFISQNTSSLNKNDDFNKNQIFSKQKRQASDIANIPTFLQQKKSKVIFQSVIFNSPFESQSTCNPSLNFFVQSPKNSLEGQQKIKDYVPSFLKNQQKYNLRDEKTEPAGFYKKFRSPEPTNPNHVSQFTTGFKANSNIRSRVDSRSEYPKNPFSPISPKTTNEQKIVSNLSFLTRKYSDDQKAQSNKKQDEKSTMNASQKNSVKIPKFLKKTSPQNLAQKQLGSVEFTNSDHEFSNSSGSSQNQSQPSSPIYYRSDNPNFKPSKLFYFNNEKQEKQVMFNKKKTVFLSSNFGKVASTPQNYPVKTDLSNFQYGRLSSPSAFNNRQRTQTSSIPKKTFSLKDFEIIEKIGKGAFGDVFKAQQISTGFLCVLKKMSKKRIKQLKLEQNIVREIKIQTFLKHKHLTQLYGFFNDEDHLYLILELLPDGSMNQVNKRKKIPELESSRYIRQVCQGLRYMHKQQIIHRDLKPENIFVYEDYIKMGDFGCAIYTQTLRKTIVGCLAYISPEQLNNQFYDDKIDVWSLGILTYQLITGKAPFEEDIVKISRQQIEPKLSKLIFPPNMQISQVCKDFIYRLLETNPQNRMSIQQAIRHPFISKTVEQDRKQEQQILGQYQHL